eukprot:g888.t1
MVSGDNKGAARYLSQAVRLEPNNSNNHYKLFRVHLRLKKYRDAVQDLRNAVKVKPTFGSALLQLAKLETKLGYCEEAAKTYRKLSDCGAPCVKSHQKAGDGLEKSMKCAALLKKAEAAKGRHQVAVNALGEVVEFAPLSHDLLLARAEAQLQLGNFHDVLADAGKALKLRKDSLDGLLLRAKGYYKLAEHDMSMRHLREGLRFDPEHKALKAMYRVLKKIMRFSDKANQAFSSGDMEMAVSMSEKAINEDKTHLVHNKTLLLLQSKAFASLKDHQSALNAAKRAHMCDKEYVDALIEIGNAQIQLDQFDEAVRSMSEALKLDENSKAAQEGKQRADAALKQSKEKNYYKILGLSRDANKREIKKAYRKMALEWHPDKHEGDAAKEAAKVKFQDIGEAYEVLSDDELKGKYDRGEEVFENQGGSSGGGGHHGFPFNMFHGGGGGTTHHFHFSHR